MAVTKFLARDLDVDVNTGTLAAPVWTAVKGLNTVSHSPSSTDAETTDFDSNGAPEHLKAERGHSWTLAGFKLIDVASGAEDPGQQAVETLSKLVGLASLQQFRITSPGGRTATFMASAEVTYSSGGNNDAAAWQAVLRVSGVITYA